MAWTRIDDKFLLNPKIQSVGVYGMALYLSSLIYCNSNLTDGFILESVLPMLCGMAYQTPAKKMADVLVDVNLWEKVEGGYQVHDFLKFNKSKQEIELINKTRAKNGAKGGRPAKQTETYSVSKPVSKQDSKQPPINPNPLKDTTTPPYPPESDPKFEALFSAYEKLFGKPPKVDSEEIAIVDEMINDGISDVEFVAAIREMDEKGYSCPAISSARQWIMNNRTKAERKAKAKSRAPSREVPDRYHIPGYVPDTSNEIVIHD